MKIDIYLIYFPTIIDQMLAYIILVSYAIEMTWYHYHYDTQYFLLFVDRKARLLFRNYLESYCSLIPGMKMMYTLI